MTVRRLFAFVFVLSLFTLSVRETIDPDMWWHLRTGEWILERGIPREDVFSFTVPGRTWITHEWLTQVLMALIWRVAGLVGLMLLFAGIILAAFWLVYRSSVARPYLAGFVVLMGLLASKPVTGARPQMFNWLFVALFLTIVEGVKDDRFDRRLFLLFPVLTVMWVNMHGGYLIGIVILGTYALGEVLQLRYGQSDARSLATGEVRWLAAAAALSLLASLINPHGYRLLAYPFETLGQEFSQQYTEEWQPPRFYTVDYWPFGILLAAGVASLALSQTRPTWTEVLLFAGTGIAALTARRHIPIFALVSAPITVRHAASVLDPQSRHPLVRGSPSHVELTRAKSILHVSVAVLLTLLAAVRIVGVAQSNDAAIAAKYPVAAVDFLENEGWVTSRRGYNHFDWGGYLIWRGVPVFIDGRPDMYGDEFMLMYMQTLGVSAEWRAPLQTYAIDYVLTKPDGPLDVLLRASQDWRQVYQDGIASILVPAEESVEGP